jgi:hypothetical protein
MLVHAGDHSRAPAKSCESGMYDSDGASYLSCSCGSCVPCSGGGGDTLWHARSSTSEDSACLALIPPLAAAILLLQSTSLDSFGDPTYSNLCDPVRGLHGDCFNLWNYFFCVQLWPDSSAEAAMWAFCTSLSDLGKESTRTFAS